MFWHLVKFRFRSDVDDETRLQAEDGARSLATSVESVRFLRLGRSVDEPDVTGLIVGFEDADGFAAYHAHPTHVPVAQQIDSLCADVTRVDFVTTDDAGTFAAL